VWILSDEVIFCCGADLTVDLHNLWVSLSLQSICGVCFADWHTWLNFD